ncbi:MAG: F0F1 ATP synthase subunit B [Salinivirgaceae bacterium]|jgi:F-type H+-transporting ATPase subunit b|nr:F0F1 ATP synthase subunit B [Salinivirgaceae bacterium]MBR3567944.1 F0F1 ATP synthase subunit B [Salinivirgaceae bacterium]
MDLVTPQIGLLFWTVLIFLVLVFLLAKFAWKPILKMVEERTKNIEDALNSAENAKKEMAGLKAENEQIMKEARAERDKIVREAREMKDKIIEESKETAKAEADKILAQARKLIDDEKRAAMNELKDQVASLSIEIAEKILTKELSDKKKQAELIDDILQQSNLN